MRIPAVGLQGDELTELTKDQARREAIRRWRALPTEDRQTHMQASVFAAGLVEELDFRTMTNRRKLIEAWLIEDLDPAVRERPLAQAINDRLAISPETQPETEGGGRNGTDQS
jgi:hypothetical protein